MYLLKRLQVSKAVVSPLNTSGKANQEECSKNLKIGFSRLNNISRNDFTSPFTLRSVYKHVTQEYDDVRCLTALKITKKKLQNHGLQPFPIKNFKILNSLLKAFK
jgi:hypothetical protein